VRTRCETCLSRDITNHVSTCGSESRLADQKLRTRPHRLLPSPHACDRSALLLQGRLHGSSRGRPRTSLVAESDGSFPDELGAFPTIARHGSVFAALALSGVKVQCLTILRLQRVSDAMRVLVAEDDVLLGASIKKRTRARGFCGRLGDRRQRVDSAMPCPSIRRSNPRPCMPGISGEVLLRAGAIAKPHTGDRVDRARFVLEAFACWISGARRLPRQNIRPGRNSARGLRVCQARWWHSRRVLECGPCNCCAIHGVGRCWATGSNSPIASSGSSKC